jgi:hypothetical protein
MLHIVPRAGQVLLEMCGTTTLLRALAILANKFGLGVLPMLPNLILLVNGLPSTRGVKKYFKP